MADETFTCPACGTEMIRSPLDANFLMHVESTDCAPDPWPMADSQNIEVIDRTGQHIDAYVPGEGRVSGVVSHSTEAPSFGETQHIITEPDDGRRPIAVRESQIKR
jgi:hypothetical protein